MYLGTIERSMEKGYSQAKNMKKTECLLLLGLEGMKDWVWGISWKAWSEKVHACKQKGGFSNRATPFSHNMFCILVPCPYGLDDLNSPYNYKKDKV